MVYTGLDRARNEIRLIRLLSATDLTSNVIFKLVHVSLDNRPSYEALSYTWRSSLRSETIILDNKTFLVTENLHSALRRLRHSDEDRRLWVDAVCINQVDILERNQEVLCILDIYRKATRVMVWLGDDSGLAMDHLLELSKQWHDASTVPLLVTISRHLASLPLLALQASLRLVRALLYMAQIRFANILVLYCGTSYRLFSDSPLAFLLYGLAVVVRLVATIAAKCGLFEMEQPRRTAPEPETNIALKNLFSRSWFRRTWIIQELIASQDALAVCGSRTIPWASLCAAYESIEMRILKDPGKSVYVDSGFQTLGILNSFQDIDAMPDLVARQRRSLLYLISSFSSFEASDSRDKVYALLSLSNETGTPESGLETLLPNYAQSVVYLYAKVIKHLVEKTGRLDVLRACLDPGRSPVFHPGYRIGQ